MIQLKSSKQIEMMRYPAQIAAEILLELADATKPGVCTAELEELAERRIAKRGATSAFKGYQAFEDAPPFPSSICTSVNNQVMNGIPSTKVVLRAGDIVTINLGVFYGGYAGDGAMSMGVGQLSDVARNLLQVTKQSLWEGIDFARVEGRLGDVGAAIQNFVEHHGFSVVRTQFGHGIGKQLHEEPPVPSYGKFGAGMRLEPGLVISVKPIVNQGTPRTTEDGWTTLTADRKLSCCFAHTIAITDAGPDILTRI